MNEKLYFDCNASFGPRVRKYPEERWTRDHLLDDLDLAGIAGALVVHEQATLYDPMLGNMALVREIEAHRDRLRINVAVVFPVGQQDNPLCRLLRRLGGSRRLSGRRRMHVRERQEPRQQAVLRNRFSHGGPPVQSSFRRLQSGSYVREFAAAQCRYSTSESAHTVTDPGRG